MKRVLIIVFLLMTTQVAVAQNWLTDLEEAKKIAVETNKSIVLVFSGSDWCAPCMKLEKNVFSTVEFKQYASENYVLLKADFPQRKKNKLSKEQQTHNNQLAEKYNKNGFFPLVVTLDSKGKSTGSLGYKNIDAKAYIESINAQIK
jgi:thioredoxin-related protein